MMMFCSRRGSKVSDWFDYPESVAEFIEKRSPYMGRDVIWVFVENEHVWIFEDGDLWEAPDLPGWCPEF